MQAILHAEEFILGEKFHKLASKEELSGHEERAMAEVRDDIHSEMRVALYREHSRTFSTANSVHLLLKLPSYGYTQTENDILFL